jgi:uracil-DNA glycosylase
MTRALMAVLAPHLLFFFPPPSSPLPYRRNLTAWAEAGVLMLNTCLTVRAHSAGSHQGKGWESFTDRVIEAVDRYGGANLGAKSGFGRGVVFLAWGAWAAKRVAKLGKVS